MNTQNLKTEIKKVKVWHVALLCAGVFLAFAIIGSVLVAAGGGWNFWNNLHFGGYHGESLTKTVDVNERGEQDLTGVTNIAIGTVSADVTVQSGGDKLVAELKGSCGYTVKPIWLDVHKDGSVLSVEVKYPSNIRYDRTQLTVTIPAEYMGDLSVGTVSAGVHAQGLPFHLKSVTLGAVSGELDFGTASYTNLTAGSVSGRISLTGIAGETSANSVSGDIDLDYAKIAPTTVVNVSGGVQAAVPQGSVFRVDFSTTSGGFSSTVEGLTASGGGHGFTGAVNGGTDTIKVNTTSGNFEIEGK